MAVKKRKPLRSLAAGRPPTLHRPKSISRKATRTLINSHHVLEKKKARALAQGDHAAVSALENEISALGGIEKYQQASLQGQRDDRGGDSSRLLMEWLKPSTGMPTGHRDGLRMLEVGALSISNECSKSGMFDMTRIDLNSQAEGILQQDFMQRPLPQSDLETFDIISLSLVLNYAPDAATRGQMLLRTLKFLKKPSENTTRETPQFFPSLFMVLPAPCVTNSRYMTEDHLEAIMDTIGYTKVKSRITTKLVYYLWVRRATTTKQHDVFKKVELRSGKSRNNFAVVLGGSTT